MNKKGYVHHPFVLAIIAFIIGMLLMWLLMRGIIPSGGIFG